MAKFFRVLKYNQDSMALIALHSHHLNEPTNEFVTSIIAYYVSILNFFIIASSFVDIYKYWPNLAFILVFLALSAAGVLAAGMYISVGLKMKKIKELHNLSQKYIDEGTFEMTLYFVDLNFIFSFYNKNTTMRFVIFTGKRKRNVVESP